MSELQKILAFNSFDKRPQLLPEFFFSEKDSAGLSMYDMPDGQISVANGVSEQGEDCIDASQFPCMVSDVPPQYGIGLITTQLDEVKISDIDDARQKLIDNVLESVEAAHMDTCAFTKPKLEVAFKAFAEKKMPMPDPSKMANMPNNMWEEKFMSNMVPVITRVVTFCKRLPGFQELAQIDQMRLIKQGSFEIALARFTPLVDEVSDAMYDPNIEVKIPRKMVQMLPMGKFLNEFFSYAAVVKPLELSDFEMGLLTTILILCPDRHGLTNKKAVFKLQGLYLQAMKQHISKTHPDDSERLTKILDTISPLRSINDRHAKSLHQMKKDASEQLSNMPVLHGEVYDGKI
ncbi:unnamed protein product [Owenia fusiformis]|uniref:Uncharacterized protein n=1 Tax=Owenia fusiformis TaxID=6347 RepID=A0A8J1XH72_OWEFU|nr:unnamed protein product [Owenia fusiformis]